MEYLCYRVFARPILCSGLATCRQDDVPWYLYFLSDPSAVSLRHYDLAMLLNRAFVIRFYFASCPEHVS